MNQSKQNLRTELEEWLRFETLLTEISASFINLPAGQIDGGIEEAQRRVCECLGLDLSSLWQWSVETPPFLTLTHLYRPLGGPQPPERMDAQEFFPWCRQQLTAGKVIAISSMDELPSEAARDQETWRHYGIKASLTIPLSAGGGPPVGALSFNTMREEHTWPEALVKRLQLVAQIFVNALGRSRTDQALRESEERLNLAAASANMGLWIVEIRSNLVWVTAKTRELFHFTPDEDLNYEPGFCISFLNVREHRSSQGFREQIGSAFNTSEC
jgi:formate hydrogenlyase transcriptional activator